MAEQSVTNGWLSASDRARLSTLLEQPASNSDAREHWKYSSLKEARLTLKKAAEPTGTTPEGINGLPEALLADSVFCPVTCEALLDMKDVDYRRIDTDGETVSLQCSDATTPVILEITAGGSATVIDESTSASQWIIVLVRRDANLSFHRLRANSEDHEWSKLQFVIEDNAQVSVRSFASGARFRRHDLSVDLIGAHARFEFIGASCSSDKSHVDLQAHVRHHAPNTQSTQRWHTIGLDRSTQNFRGRIYIGANCPGVAADLNNRNLSLGEGVTINTKPELEIYSDDVRCAHGATVGQLDDEALFYLRARGIDAVSAQRMLSEGFLRECMDGPLADAAAAALMQRLQ